MFQKLIGKIFKKNYRNKTIKFPVLLKPTIGIHENCKI